MSLVKDILDSAIDSVVKTGEIEHKFEVKGLTFVLRGLTAEEEILADGMVDTSKIKEKYGAQNLMTLQDTIHKHRTLARVALSTRTVNGKPPVDKEANLEDQFKQREEFKSELMGLNSAMLDLIIREFGKLNEKQIKFFENVEKSLEKS